MSSQQQTIKEKGRKQTRYSKGIVLAISARIYKVKDQDVWYVESGTKQGKYYRVTFAGCECPDYTRRQSSFKHLIAVMATEDMTQEIIAESGV